jgi:hypothetical protein
LRVETKDGLPAFLPFTIVVGAYAEEQTLKGFVGLFYTWQGMVWREGIPPNVLQEIG